MKPVLHDLDTELQELRLMSNEEVCKRYNVDKKEEAIQLLLEWIEHEGEEEDSTFADYTNFTYSPDPLNRWKNLII